MISVSEATNIIQAQLLELTSEEVEMYESLGRVLEENLVADRDFPPYDRVTMDGIAIKGEEYVKGRRKFSIQELCAAGDPKCKLVTPSDCIEIMTGAILPDNTNSIIRYEDIMVSDGIATINEIKFNTGQNVHRQASDHQMGALLVEKGIKISPAEIGIAATIGKNKIRVQKLPRIAVISSGDELVDIDQIPKEHQIRKSNVIQMKSSLEKFGFPSQSFHMIDNYNMICEHLEKLITEFDVLILSGGVSKGKKDFIPDALEKIGVKKLFHKIAQRPGKPFWFGQKDNKTFIFALPGNPVSSFMCLHSYVIPWLKKNQGIADSTPYIELGEDISFKPNLTYFVPVKKEYSKKGTMIGIPSLGNGSGDFANLLYADGFVELPQGRDHYPSGSVYKFIAYR